LSDSFHGSALSESDSPDAPIRDQSAASRSCRLPPRPQPVPVVGRGRRRDWITRAGACPATTPAWTSRDGWLDALRRWANSDGLAQLCRTEGVSITAPTLLAVATAMAGHADHATGRNVAVTRATLAAAAGCDVRTVTTAWRVLRTARWAVEAQRGHGSPDTPSVGRRPSIYHLVSRRERHSTPGDHFHLPPLGGVCPSSPVGTYSPSAPKARRQESQPMKARPWRCAPRPLALQRLAAEVIGRCHGLGHAHSGGICDALTAAGIDPQLWTARQITDALNADMAARGWSWPDRIERPGAFLASRLRRLDWRPAGPPIHNDGGSAAGTDRTSQPPAATAVRCAPPIPATDAHRADAMASIRATLTGSRGTLSTRTHASAGHRGRSVEQSCGHHHQSTDRSTQLPDQSDRLTARTNPPVGHPIRTRATTDN
jgi:hypothetical protein